MYSQRYGVITHSISWVLFFHLGRIIGVRALEVCVFFEACSTFCCQLNLFTCPPQIIACAVKTEKKLRFCNRIKRWHGENECQIRLNCRKMESVYNPVRCLLDFLPYRKTCLIIALWSSKSHWFFSGGEGELLVSAVLKFAMCWFAKTSNYYDLFHFHLYF